MERAVKSELSDTTLAIVTGMWKIRVAQSDDEQAIVAMFERAQLVTAGAYPPKIRTDQEDGVKEWLAIRNSPARRLVAVCRDGEIIGHIDYESLRSQMSCDADASGKLAHQRYQYWKRAFADQPGFSDQLGISLSSLVVINHLLVDLTFQRLGLGRELLRISLRDIHAMRRVPALIVAKDRIEAITLYESEGGRRLGEFIGNAGVGLYSYVFLQTFSECE